VAEHEDQRTKREPGASVTAPRAAAKKETNPATSFWAKVGEDAKKIDAAKETETKPAPKPIAKQPLEKKPSAAPKKPVTAKPSQPSQEELKATVLQVLQAAKGKRVHLDQIIKKTGLEGGQVNAGLVLLELSNQILRYPGGEFALVIAKKPAAKPPEKKPLAAPKKPAPATPKEGLFAPRATEGKFAGRPLRPDGRLEPQPGDQVYMVFAGFGGMPASVKGEVYSSKKGLRVKITGSHSALGGEGGVSGPKAMDLDEEWTVEGDPEINRRVAAQNAKREAGAKAKQETAAKREQAHQEWMKETRKRGKVTPEKVKPGDIVQEFHPAYDEPHYSVVHGMEERGIQGLSEGDDPTERRPYDLGDPVNMRLLNRQEIAKLPDPLKEHAKQVRTGKVAQHWEKVEREYREKEESQERAQAELAAKHGGKTVGDLVGDAKSAPLGVISSKDLSLKVSLQWRKNESRIAGGHYEVVLHDEGKKVPLHLYFSKEDSLGKVEEDIKGELAEGAVLQIGASLPAKPPVSRSATPRKTEQPKDIPDVSQEHYPGMLFPGSGNARFNQEASLRLGHQVYTKQMTPADAVDLLKTIGQTGNYYAQQELKTMVSYWRKKLKKSWGWTIRKVA